MQAFRYLGVIILAGLMSACASKQPPTPQVANGPGESAHLRNPAPPYPELARQSGHQGTVHIYVRLDATGRITHIGVAKSSGSPLLDASALETCSKWVFRPARNKQGQPIAAEVKIPIHFGLQKQKNQVDEPGHIAPPVAVVR